MVVIPVHRTSQLPSTLSPHPHPQNIRFKKEEDLNDSQFAKALVESTGATVYVNEGFSVSHRAHASTVGVPLLLSPLAVAGYCFLDELHHFNELLLHPKKPFAAIIGGSKVSTKLNILKHLLTKVPS